MLLSTYIYIILHLAQVCLSVASIPFLFVVLSFSNPQYRLLLPPAPQTLTLTHRARVSSYHGQIRSF